MGARDGGADILSAVFMLIAADNMSSPPLRPQKTIFKNCAVAGFSKVDSCSEQKWNSRVASKSGMGRAEML